MLSDVWSIIKGYLNNAEFSGSDELYYTALQRIASDIARDTVDEVSLENKLLISIATRLLVEKFLKRKLLDNGQPCNDSESNQTRDWLKQADDYLSGDEKSIIEEVNLITPESIHLNAFMYEPLIDISDWTLKELFQRASSL